MKLMKKQLLLSSNQKIWLNIYTHYFRNSNQPTWMVRVPTTNDITFQSSYEIHLWSTIWNALQRKATLSINEGEKTH